LKETDRKVQQASTKKKRRKKDCKVALRKFETGDFVVLGTQRPKEIPV
jgi:hypothetical protein